MTQGQKRKITVQLWGPLLAKLNEQAADACLNRDAYLDKVFAHEAAMLRKELKGKRNSDRARAFIKQCFAQVKDLRQVSFTLGADTADSLTDACDKVNVWRDVFVNRVIYFLVARSSVIESQLDFQFGDHADSILDDGWERSILLGPRLGAIRDLVVGDPFLSIRLALSSAYPDGCSRLHDLPLFSVLGKKASDRDWTGFTVYLEDQYIPGTPEYEELSNLL
jgi:hypothetical protein